MNPALVTKFDRYTNEAFSFSPTVHNASGGAMTDADVDNVIYCKGFDGLYYKRNFTGPINVRWFGAKGDGVTDDSDAIQATIDFVKNTPKVEGVYLDKATYLVGKTITINGSYTSSGFVLSGSRTYIKASPDLTGPVLLIGTKDNPAFQYRKQLTIRDLTLAGNLSVDPTHAALKIDEESDVRLEDVYLRDAYAGLWINGALICSYTNCTFVGNQIGILANATTTFQPNEHTFNVCKVLNNKQGINWRGGSAILFQNTEIEENNKDGAQGDGNVSVDFLNTGHVTFNTCWLENNKGTIDLRYVAKAAYNNLVLINCEIISFCDTLVSVDGGAAGQGTLTTIGGRINNSAAINDIVLGPNIFSASFNNTIGNVTGNLSKAMFQYNGCFSQGFRRNVAAFSATNPPNNILTQGTGDNIHHNFYAADGTLNGYIAYLSAQGAFIRTDKSLPIIFSTNTTRRWQITAGGSFWPDQDAAVDIGAAATQVRNVYTQGLRVNGDVIGLSGTTAQRPTTTTIGYQYFDTTLGKPIYLKSAGVWVDATGTEV